MAFLEDMHLPRSDPKPTVVNETRAIDFSGHYFKAPENKRAKNSPLPSELFLRYFVQLQQIQSLLKSRRRLSATPQCVGCGLPRTLLVNSSPVSPLSAIKAAGAEMFLLFFCNYHISRATSTTIPKKMIRHREMVSMNASQSNLSAS